MDDLLKDFVVETSEHLDIVDAELVRFERDPNNSATLALIFRLVHTIKGTCGFLGLPRLEHLAHAGEDVISGFRDGKPVTAPAVTMILKTIDRIKGIIAELERSGSEPDGDDEDLVQALRALANEPAGAPPLATAPPPAVTIESKGNLSFQILERPLREDEVTLDELERAFRDAPGPEMPPFVEPAPVAPPPPPAPAAEAPKEAPRKEKKAAPKVEAKAEPEAAEAQASNENSVSKQSVRVAVGTLDRLMTMVSELVLTRNQLLEIARQRDDADFKSPLQRLSHITAELQDGVMQTRMQPIGSAWTKLSRVVRDLSEELGKKIELIQSGAETEIDRQLLEMIKDPLLHMVRNAADHGLEMPDERVAAGKPAHGTIHLRAAQESGYIIVEVSDDGRGIDVERVKAKALRNGLSTEADIARMSDEQILRFVMEPGFSTAAAVTNISGRGVGLDVVRSHVEQVGGIVDLRSRAGRGLTVTIKLPLTLAIASALIVEAAGQRFAIPQISVAELVRTQESGEVRIETLNGQATLRLRQRLLPVVDVADVLNLPRQGGSLATDNQADDRLVVVCHVGGHRFGIIVDSILHTEEIVVKPISSKLRHMSVYSGATILGDGSVILILEPAGVARSVMENGTRETAAQSEAELAAELMASAERSLLLLFRAGGTNLKAIPLAFIGRLEEFEHAKIEDTGGRAVVQYQGRLMPILGYQPQAGFDLEARQPVLVFHQQDREIGMAVDEIVDVVEVSIQIDTSHATPGTVGATIIDGKAVEIVDVSDLVAPEGQEKPASDEQVDVMVIESSEFFRALFAPLLQNAGYRIAVLPSLQAARLAIARQKPSVIVMDLDQPGDEGFSFVRELAEDGTSPPVIGLVSRAGPRLIEKGKVAGLYDLVGKFDRQGLMSSVGDVLGGYSTTQWGAAA
ncbi:MAG: hybrid sensor histidine kinase/response regulator [Beijerinckiaceae bacterium]|nr:hybrid sensor histidine kinase/response regulator [Beijerinckiaceae bacterium]